MSEIEVPAPLYTGDVQVAMQELANRFAGTLSEESVDAMLRVRQFVRYAEIDLSNRVAATEALRYVRAVPNQRYYILWLDMSVTRNHARARALITAYVQAMRTAIGRLRREIRRTGTGRRLRNFGISVVEAIELPECPQLWRVVLDNRHDPQTERLAKLINSAEFDALTVHGTDSDHGGSELEQLAELQKRGLHV